MVQKKALASFAIKPRPDLSQQLSQQIIDLIVAQDMQPGDRLPTTKELASQFAVATPTIREALRRLQVTGVIDIRHGSGIYVLHREQGMMIANPHYGDLDAKSLLDLLDARLLIEPYLAGVAARTASDDEMSELRKILVEAERLLSGQPTQLSTKNMLFHAAIAQISQNRILAQMLQTLIGLYGSEQLTILRIVNARMQDHLEHVEIFEAICAHDAPLASERMEVHLTNVRTVIAERLHEASTKA